MRWGLGLFVCYFFVLQMFISFFFLFYCLNNYHTPLYRFLFLLGIFGMFLHLLCTLLKIISVFSFAFWISIFSLLGFLFSVFIYQIPTLTKKVYFSYYPNLSIFLYILKKRPSLLPYGSSTTSYQTNLQGTKKRSVIYKPLF